jgi:hypothetical protein
VKCKHWLTDWELQIQNGWILLLRKYLLVLRGIGMTNGALWQEIDVTAPEVMNADEGRHGGQMSEESFLKNALRWIL